MDDLPELPFEKVLSYLSLEDRLKARAVSRRWYHQINSFRVKSLCYSSRPSDVIFEKSRWISGAFAQNFISSSRFAMFFGNFDQTILSSLKRLRLCDLHLSEEDQAAFARTLNSFGHLKELDIVRAECSPAMQFNLNLPMLTSLQFEEVRGIEKLALEAPRLREVKILDCSGLRVDLVHGESVERLLVDRLNYTDVKKLKNLKALYIGDLIEVIDPTLLSSLRQLKEFHLQSNRSVSRLFEQEQRLCRADLKIYLSGLLLNGPRDPARNTFRDAPLPGFLIKEWPVCLAENRSRLADLIPFYRHLDYSAIQPVAPGLEVDLLKRFTDLNRVHVVRPVQDTQRFLDLLKNFNNIVDLRFWGDHPRDLFDRLPEHCAVQILFIIRKPCDLGFLFRLKELIRLYVHWSIDKETIRRAFEELPVLSYFEFKFGQKIASIQIVHPNQFLISINYKRKAIVADLNAAIEIVENQ